MTIDPQLALAIALPTIAAIAWLVRLEGRITTNENRIADLKADVTYIRARIDEALKG